MRASFRMYKLARVYFDVAGGQLRVARALVTQDDFTGHGDDVFTAHVLSLAVGASRAFFAVENDLGDAVTIAQIEKGEHDQNRAGAPPSPSR